jgi:LacI family transcriptional regulator
MALQVLDVVLDSGFRVPEDISVVGFDDIPFAAHHSIQLTTVDAHFRDVALLTIEHLISQLKGVRPSGKPDCVFVEPHLRVRGTTGEPRRETSTRGK